MAGRPQSAMRTLRLLPPYLLALGLPALPLPVVAQDTSSSSPADQGTDQPEATGPAITSPEAFKIFVEACTSLASGEAGADQRAASAGWTANEASSTGPFSTVYSGYRDLNGLGEVDIWGAVYSYPTQRLGYCRVDFSDPDNILDFNDVTGINGLTGSAKPGDNSDVYGAWETPDKKLLVIGDRTEGVVELEFNALLGTKPAS